MESRNDSPAGQDEAKKLQEKTVQETEAKGFKKVQREGGTRDRKLWNKLLQEVRGYAAALTIAFCRKISQKSFGRPDKKRLVDESIEQVIQELEKRQRN
ncbi:MAG: hypothetical protein Ct9H300mP23_11380 [Nitrospinota bacterium]|nr:MAG: hypothetical protein Ct9H300mP23_11380 [Nitrospinota bacterium]